MSWQSYAGMEICTLRVLDQYLNEDGNYSEIPLVPTSVPVQKGDLVAVMLLYSGNEAYILGRYGE